MADKQNTAKQQNKPDKQTWEQSLPESSNTSSTQKGTGETNEAGTEKGGKSVKARGVELLVDKAIQSTIRLPLLEITYDRFVRINSSSLRNYTADNVDVDIVSIDSKRFGDYIDKVPTSIMLSVFKVIEWDNFGLIAIDAPMIYSFVEVLFGGKKSIPNLKVEGRPFTSIENVIVKSITEIILHDLTTAFDLVTPATFQLDRIEINPRLAMIVRPEDVVIVLNLKVTMDTRVGNIDIILPYSTLEPAKKILSKSYIGERGGKDPNWMRHFESEVNKATVKIEVMLNSIVTELKDIANLKVGKTIILDKLANTDWDIKLNKVKLSSGKPGKVGDKLAIRLNDGVNVGKYKE